MHRYGQGNHLVPVVCGLLRLNTFLAAGNAATAGDRTADVTGLGRCSTGART